MKPIRVVLGDLERKVATTWAATLVADEAGQATGNPEGPPGADLGSATWPLRLPLGTPPKALLAIHWPTVQEWAIEWRDWATGHGLTLDWANRVTDGIRQSLPTHLTVPDLDTAAGLVGEDWPDRLTQARARLLVLRDRFPHAATARTLAAVERLTDTDFGLLLDAAAWFAEHDATGLTPRQVPLEGVHGKWLNAHQGLVQTLSGKDTLGLVERPTRVHFTYLDPDHLAAGGRLHDSHTFGDASRPAYQPRLVVITENKDTAVLFPALPEAISIEGNGTAGPALIPRLDWVHAAEHVIYWGDIDAAGYDIVHRYRANGLQMDTILMDTAAYENYERYGAWTDEKNNPLRCPDPKPLGHLTPAEREVYQRLTDPGWDRVRRIEQERIPLEVAYQRLLSLTRAPLDPATRDRLLGWLPAALDHLVDAYYDGGPLALEPVTDLTVEDVLARCEQESASPPHDLLHFDTSAGVLRALGVDLEEAAHCLANYPALAPADDGDLAAGERFLALMEAGLTGSDAAAAHQCGLAPEETQSLLNLRGPGYLTAWREAGYGEPELRSVLASDSLPPVEHVHTFTALRTLEPEPTRDW